MNNSNFVFILTAIPALVAAAGAVGTGIGFIAHKVYVLLARKLNAAQLTLLMEVATRAVQYAEQVYVAGNGETKKAAAIEAAQTFLAAYGMKVSAAQLNAAIEAAVYATLTAAKAEAALPAVPAEPAPAA